MTVTTDLTPTDAPMARLLSPILMVAQWICAILFVLLMLMTAFMIFPSAFRDDLLSQAPNAMSSTNMIGHCLASAVVAIGWFFVLRFLRGVVNAVVHGDPFLPENIARLRNIWIIFMITEIFRMMAVLILGNQTVTDEIAASGNALDIRLGTWFFIFIIVVISEAFRHGAALRAEQELTI